MRHSYSSWATFLKCPAKFKFAYIDKEPQPKISQAGERGKRIHDSIEQFFLTEGSAPLDSEIHAEHGLWFTHLMEDAENTPEVEWRLNVELTELRKGQTMFAKGFFDLQTMHDGELDIYEWKTGKIYDDHLDQRFLYGLAALALFPEQDIVRVIGKYLDQKGKEVVNEYKRKDLLFLRKEWRKRFNQIEEAAEQNLFPTKPSWGCRYCAFSKQNGGKCKF